MSRIFKTGATRIVEDESLAGKPLDEVTAILKRTYPEVAHATIRETTLDDGSTCYHFINRPGLSAWHAPSPGWIPCGAMTRMTGNWDDA